MSKRSKQWARQARERLTTILGGQCVFCGTQENLTFDCIKPRGHEHHKFATDKRMTFYRREFQMGNLQVLCASCNSSKQANEQPVYIPADPDPF